MPGRNARFFILFKKMFIISNLFLRWKLYYPQKVSRRVSRQIPLNSTFFALKIEIIYKNKTSKNPWNHCNSKGFVLVGMTGFEPAAFASRTHSEMAIFQPFKDLVSQAVSLAEISPCIFRAADITEELSVCV